MPAKIIMVQGTGSSVGKSVLVTALCRIFKQQGLKVAPFKAQNMSLNSYITAAGEEIGRAQAVQAEAAGITPAAEMNPVLLKPEADNCSQIVVRGRPLARVSAADFPKLKTILWKAITESVDYLRHSFEVVVIEGAGSPAEVNLKDRDLVNMKIALYCHAPVLLAADIDRGGVFASLVGTLALLEPAEQDRIQAFVINKFRGDLSLLTPGLEWLEQRTGIPVAGVVPYYHEIYIPEEDSMALEKRRALKLRQDYDLDIAVIGLPHIANFDEFDPLLREPRVRLRYVETADVLGAPDLIILPGTKSTVADLAYLRTTGRDGEIIRQVSQGVALIGICGGYQILGKTIYDPDKIESAVPQTTGLGLLPVTTHFLPMKSTHQVKATAVLKGGLLAKARDIAISGYEIHMGQTSGENISQPFHIAQRADKFCSDFDGAMSDDGNVLGTYIHGLFHNDHLRRAVLAELAERKGRLLPPMTSSFSIEEQYDKLAVHVRQSLNMELVLRLLDRQ